MDFMMTFLGIIVAIILLFVFIIMAVVGSDGGETSSDSSWTDSFDFGAGDSDD